MTERAQHEIDHGRYLSEIDPERAWGWGTPAGRLRAERRAKLIVDGARLSPGMHALEIGCGTGLFTEYFAGSGARITAVDISRELLTIARRRRGGLRHVEFVAARFEDFPVDAQFDAVIGSSVLHHLELTAALDHIYRLLTPGGHCSFAEPNMLNPQIFLERHVPAVRRRLHVSPDETAFFASLLRRHGFVDVRITPFDWLHPFTPPAFIGLVGAVGRVFERLPLVREFSGSLVIRCRKPLTALARTR
jgi:2-polyprenyl-3-methyl-5-hydroxy-6-metoxy-1,4-benzoquinol methylase